MKSFLAIVTVLILPCFFNIVSAATDPNANDPTMERYCDPAQNADVMAKVQGYQTQLEAIDAADQTKAPQKMLLRKNIIDAAKNLKCTYRPKNK